MRIVCFSIFLLFSISCVAQEPCGFSEVKNTRPDTITTFIFSDTTIQISNLSHITAISNFSFENQDYSVSWYPYTTTNIDRFINRSIKETGLIITDTVTATFLGRTYSCLQSATSKKQVAFLCYQNVNGSHEILYLQAKSKKLTPDKLLLAFKNSLSGDIGTR